VPHHKDKTRQRMRRDSAIERERVALEMLVLGRRNVEIARRSGSTPPR
jgi:DNA-binding CsgD family transcriptional regulator